MAARAFQASVSANGYSIPSTGIKYRAYSDEAGWSAWKTNGAAAGDTSMLVSPAAAPFVFHALHPASSL